VHGFQTHPGRYIAELKIQVDNDRSFRGQLGQAHRKVRGNSGFSDAALWGHDRNDTASEALLLGIPGRGLPAGMRCQGIAFQSLTHLRGFGVGGNDITDAVLHGGQRQFSCQDCCYDYNDVRVPAVQACGQGGHVFGVHIGAKNQDVDRRPLVFGEDIDRTAGCKSGIQNLKLVVPSESCGKAAFEGP
jgi:hypothetical protein